MSGERKTGVVKWYDADKGYGFILPDEALTTGRDLFVHASALTRSLPPLNNLTKGQQVSYEVETNRDKPCAVALAVLV